MIFCTKCGALLNGTESACPTCGNPQAQPVQPQQPYSGQLPPQQPYYAQPAQPQQPYYTQPVQPQQPYYTQPAQPQPYHGAPATPALGMGWFKFLIYFALFAGAVLNLISGIQMLTGASYEGHKDLVYAFYDGLQALDMLVGIGTIAVAALAIFTRFRLAGYYHDGPKLLTAVYVAVVALNVIYLIGLFAVVPNLSAEDLNMSSYISSTAVSAVMIFVNISYFNKRSHLFVN